MKKISLTIFAFAFTLSNSFAQSYEYEIKAKKLDQSRNNLSPKTGGSSYKFNRSDIDNLPQGQASSLNQVLLRAPGVSQDSYGQIHIRNDHSNIQYRINDVIIPEGINGFGQVLDTRFADSIDLITGALPAQYGYRTAGVVEIKTKDHVSKKNLDKGFYSEAIYGSNRTSSFNQQISGSKAGLNYFLSASYLQNNRGLESPTPTRKSIHNQTRQDKIFGYFSYLVGDKNRLSLILANATNRYQIPNIADQKPEFEVTNIDPINSANINQRQSESNRFAVIALQGINDYDIDYQISAFSRQSSLKFRGDEIGDLIFSGNSSQIDRSSLNSGVQADFSKEINNRNTLRAGLYFSNTGVKDDQNNLLFAIDKNDNVATTPFAIKDGSKKNTQLYSLYIQNEYKASEKLNFNFGGRFDMVQSIIDDHHFSPRAGAIYKLSSKTKFHAGYSRYFTAPKAEIVSNLNINRFANTTNSPETFLNNKVLTEKTDYYDIGIKHQFNKELSFGIDSYYKKVKDMLDEGQFGSALIFKPFNYEKAEIYGVELTSDYKKNNFSAYANLALQKARAFKINSGEYLHEEAELDYTAKHRVHPDHAQKITASLGLAYKIADTNIGSDAIFGSGLRRGEANTLSMPSYTQINLFAVQDFKKFKLRFSVNNALDKIYRLRDGSGIGVGTTQYSPRRSFYLIASTEF